MSSRSGPPKHQNQFAWKPKAGIKINETEVGGRFRPLPAITGVCQRCKEQIDWKRRYGKYKTLIEPAKCQQCSKRAVRHAYHNLCSGCAKEQKVCAKCRCRVDHIVGRDAAEVEAEQKTLEDAIKNARERDRRTLLRSMNKGISNNKTSEKPATTDGKKVGDLFPSASLEGYAAKAAGGHIPSVGDLDEDDDGGEEEVDDEEVSDEEGDDVGENDEAERGNGIEEKVHQDHH